MVRAGGFELEAVEGSQLGGSQYYGSGSATEVVPWESGVLFLLVVVKVCMQFTLEKWVTVTLLYISWQGVPVFWA